MLAAVALLLALAAPHVEAEPYTVKQLIDRGAPAPDREWSAQDLQRFAAVIKGIAGDEPARLPRFGTASGAMIKRAVSEENFGLLRDKNVDVDDRMTEAVSLLQASSVLAGAYVSAANHGGHYGREMLELQALIIKSNVRAWSITDEFLAKLTPDERAARSGGLDQMRSGSAEIAIGAVMSFAETKVYESADLRWFAATIADPFVDMNKRLTRTALDDTRGHLAGVARITDDAELRKLLEQILARLQDWTLDA